MMSMNQAHC